MAETMPMVDVHFLVYPIVRKFLKFDINEINLEKLEKSIKLPLSRELFSSAATLLNPAEFESGKVAMDEIVKDDDEGKE